jgi:4-amino-4-deoxy-L-arabinose transferase-like glycosyltransferase
MAVPTPPSGKEWLNKISRWFVLHPYWALTLAVLAALGPFLAKPFNIDDPLFIWTARQIHAHPTDPYGFNVEWGWTAFPMWKVTENPPLAGYYLAAAAGIFGWSEIALHFAFLLPALAVVLGTYRLARHFCHQPVLAALATLFTPVFLVSSLTVMCDVTLLAFWVWTVVFWVEGMEQKNLWKLFVAGLLIALAEMTKYYGACLIPLLAVHSLINQRRVGQWAQFMLIPLAVLCAYQYVTQAAYGYSLLYRAMDYASFSQGLFAFSKMHTGLVALAFTGGGLAVAAFFAPLLWRPRGLAAFAGGAGLILFALVLDGEMWKRQGPVLGLPRISVEIQFVFWATIGLSVLALAVADLVRRRDAHVWLLGLWVLGTFVFAAFCNWTVNARSLLPMTPAVGILIARRLGQGIPAGGGTWSHGVVLSLAASASLAVWVTRSDFLLTAAVRRCAEQICARYGRETGTLWFQGHWGFQYYMQSFGASALDVKHSPLRPGDDLVVPSNNTNLLPPNPERAELLEVLTVPGPRWLTTWNTATGAGFYASVWGPLPFAFGRVPPEGASVYVLKR